mmetsp:Transcript_8657/g.32415  ORF Transcript_8657/g.32415 Transcript_8657/m.32415 type:complete len:216 (-) Transcript_8657:899-1546(-)
MPTSDVFASPSGSPFNEESAMSASSLASRRASSMPNALTISIDRAKSPGAFSNRPLIKPRNSSPVPFSFRRSANRMGAVRLPVAKSCPCGFPSCASVCVKSRISSTTWNAKPRCLPYSYMSTLMSSLTPLNTAALLQLAAISDAVLLWLFSRYSSRVTSTLYRDPACDISPSAKSAMTCEINLITSRLSRLARYQEDCANRKSPARIATRVPYNV